MTDQQDAAAVRVFPPAVPALAILMGVALNRIWPPTFGESYRAYKRRVRRWL